MAHLNTLAENWTLRDEQGILKAFPVDMPCPVADALRQQGLLPRRPVGLDGLRDGWIYSCRWLYETCFDWDGQDERCQLVCACLLGLKQILVNGVAFSAAAQAVNVDISQALQQGENRLCLIVGCDMGAMGVYQPVKLRWGNYLTVEQWAVRCVQEGIEATLTLDVHTSGRFSFNYGVTLDADAVRTIQMEEKLFPGQRQIRHLLTLTPIAFDAERPEETSYAVRLSIERQTIGCQLLIADLAWTDKPLHHLARISAFATPERRESQALLARGLGAQAVVGGLVSPVSGLLLGQEEGTRQAECAALCQYEDLEAMAGDQPFWPPRAGGVWALMGGDRAKICQIEELFGPNALGDGARACRLTRFYQAEKLRQLAMHCRMEGEKLLVTLQDDAPLFASAALVEHSGAARPAYDALQQAWRETTLYAELPQDFCAHPGADLSVPLWVMARADRQVASLTAQMLTMDGQELNGLTLPVMLGDKVCAGQLRCMLPQGEGVYILRMKLEGDGGRCLAQLDYVLCACQGKAPLAPLMDLPSAALREKEGMLVNQGHSAVLGVCSAGYRALLPGEGMPCADTYECLNGLI